MKYPAESNGPVAGECTVAANFGCEGNRAAQPGRSFLFCFFLFPYLAVVVDHLDAFAFGGNHASPDGHVELALGARLDPHVVAL